MEGLGGGGGGGRRRGADAKAGNWLIGVIKECYRPPLRGGGREGGGGG